MTNENPLKEALKRASGKPSTPVVTETPNSSTAPSRQGKKALVVYMEPEAAKEVRRVALEHGKSIQALGIEAWNDLLVRYGSKPIA